MFNWVKNALSGASGSDQAAEASAHKRRGNALLDEGKWEQAEACYRQALALTPEDVDAWTNLGFVLTEQKRYVDARQALNKVLTLDARAADACYMLGAIAQGHGESDEAIERFQRALAIKPDFAEACFNLGGVLQGLQRYEEALGHYDQAIQLRPGLIDAYSSRGIVLGLLGRHEQALADFDALLRLQPGHVLTILNRANELMHLQRHEAALAGYDHALQLRPDDIAAWTNRGLALGQLGRAEEELASYEAALRIDPDFVDALFDRGLALERGERFEDALASFDRALQAGPDHAGAHCHRGNALRRLGRLENALAAYEHALRLNPRYAEAHTNRGVALAEMNRHAEALPCFTRALELQPDNAGAHFNEGVCRLQLGDMETGWEKFELRWEATPLRAQQRDFAQPAWLGKQSVHGKAVLLHAEQGFGDTIQFCRYAKLVAALGGAVTLEVQPGLESLLAGLEGVDRIVVKGQELPFFDYHCPLMSLPLAFGTVMQTVPAQDAYIKGDPARIDAWRARLGVKTRPRIGLVWAGGTWHSNDVNRSIGLAQLVTQLVKPLSGRASFVSLQKDLRPADAQVLDEYRDVAHFGDRLTDFSETAALAANLDLVISVDTSVAHLAGAMGKPLWLLLPFNADWRWLLDCDRSPWYPGARLFRQPKAGDWESVMSAIVREIENQRPGEHV